MPWNAIVTWLGEYLKNKPTTDLILVLGLGVFIWVEKQHINASSEAHNNARQIFREVGISTEKIAKERDEANERNTDKIITALTGVRQEQKKANAVLSEVKDVAKEQVEATQAIPLAAAEAVKAAAELKEKREKPE